MSPSLSEEPSSEHGIPRRHFLKTGTAGGIAVLAGPAVVNSPAHGQVQQLDSEQANNTFVHGVASGDPLHDRVIIWTRISGVASNLNAVSVSWSVSTDEAMLKTVAEGTAQARLENDWTVHVDVVGLKPATTYWYRFQLDTAQSPLGRTRTSRRADDPGEIQLGVVSCSALPGGFFNAYRRLAQREVDLVVHLGDYIYESFRSRARDHDNPDDPLTLEDYRGRYRQYRRDPDLQLLHRRHPMSSTWDDHEVSGNAWSQGSSRHNAAKQGTWQQRRSAAIKAYFEWLPVRRADRDSPERIWRSIPLGGAAELILIDTRHDGRDRQVSDNNPDPLQALDDPNRSMMSVEQRDWLRRRLLSSPSTWRLVANQVLFSPFRLNLPGVLADFGDRFGVLVNETAINPDSWDGYGGERTRVLAHLARPEAANTVFLTGDVHSSWAFEVPALGQDENPKYNPVAVEIVVPAISSSPFGSVISGSNDIVDEYLGEGNVINELVTSAIEGQLDYLRWAEVSSNGYVLASISPKRVWAEWWHVKGTGPNDKGEHRAAVFQINAGAARLLEADPEDSPQSRSPQSRNTSGSTKNGSSDKDSNNPPSPVAFGAVGLAVTAAVGAAVAIRRRNL